MAKRKSSSASGDLGVEDVRCFVPARDFARSLRFYELLGWKSVWTDDDGLSLMELAGSRFMLQNFFVREWAENSVISVLVSDAVAWFHHIENVLASDAFPSARVHPPQAEPWGATVTYAWDPSGVLLQFTQFPG